MLKLEILGVENFDGSFRFLDTKAVFGALLGEAGDQIGGRRSCIDVMEAAQIVPSVSRRTDERIRSTLGFELGNVSHVESVSETLSNVSETLGTCFGDKIVVA